MVEVRKTKQGMESWWLVWEGWKGRESGPVCASVSTSGRAMVDAIVGVS